tara:strand:+ start:657 stop:827 length:171 start_codon:yes stop_codon:yes gene_type:complete
MGREHSCPTLATVDVYVAEQLNWIHCLFQEIENSGYELPMGTYEIVYSILEDARDK